MAGLYPPIEPYDRGLLDVGDGNQIYWETSGNPGGKPAVFLHGGPGSGFSKNQHRLFNPANYRTVMFDQRNCGRSVPHASLPDIDLAANNTMNLVGDIEKLRTALGIERWLVAGASWGSLLGLAYAEEHTKRVSELVLFSVTTGRHLEFDWLFRGGLGVLFPQQWERLCEAAPLQDGESDLIEAFCRLLKDSDAGVRERAAFEWCMWESATPAWPPVEGLLKVFEDQAFRLAFARIVTHFVRHNAWLEDGELLRNVHLLHEIPAVLLNGRFDFQTPIGFAWELHRAWPQAELVIVDDAGHTGGNPRYTEEIVSAIARFAV